MNLVLYHYKSAFLLENIAYLINHLTLYISCGIIFSLNAKGIEKWEKRRLKNHG